MESEQPMNPTTPEVPINYYLHNPLSPTNYPLDNEYSISSCQESDTLFDGTNLYSLGIPTLQSHPSRENTYLNSSNEHSQ